MNKFVGIHVLDCNGEKHRIGIPVSGSVVLFNHRGKSGKHARLIQDMFTQKACACTQFLNEWKKVNQDRWSYTANTFPLMANRPIRDARKELYPKERKDESWVYRTQQYKQRLMEIVYKARRESEQKVLENKNKHTVFDGFSLERMYGRTSYVYSGSVEKRTVDGKCCKFVSQKIEVDYSEFIKLVVNKCHIVDGQVLTRIVDKSDDSIWEVEAIRFVDAELPRPRSNSPVCPYKQAVIQKAWIARVGSGYPWLTLTWQS